MRAKLIATVQVIVDCINFIYASRAALRCTFVLLAFFCCGLHCELCAAEPKLRAAPGVAAQLQRVQFRILAGRITCSSDAIGGRLSFGAKSLGREENLTVDLSTPQPAIEYALVGRQWQVAITISEGDRLRVTCRPRGSSSITPMIFEQTPGKALLLTLGEGDAQREYRAKSFWHLALSEPVLIREHLIWILGVLRPGWSLAEQVEQIETALLSTSELSPAPDRSRLAKLVVQLGAEEFSRRQEADHELAALGYTALSYLESIDRDGLDAEQNFRVRRLVAKLGGAREEDLPQTVARRLATDPQVWLALLGRSNAETRQTAKQRLERVLGHSVALDPGGDAEVRAEQLEALRGED